MAGLRVKRGTRAQLEAAAAAAQLHAGEPYLVTDEGRLAVGLGADGFQAMALETELAEAAASREVWDVWVWNHCLDVDAMSLWGSAIGGGGFASPTLALTQPERHPGVLLLKSAATANSGYRITSRAPHLSLSRQACVQCILAVSGLATGTIRAGLLDATSASDVTDGLYWEINGLTLRGKTAANASRSQTATACTLLADTMYRLELRANADYTAVTFTVYDLDGGLLWTDTLATNLPVTTDPAHWSALGLVATNSAAAAANLCHLDYLGGGTWNGWLHHLGQGLKGEKGDPGPVGDAVPAGAVLAFAMPAAPAGWLKCNGAAVSRTTYAALFAALGTTFGAGDGSTTFNLPDLRGEFVRGWDDGRGVDASRTLGSAQGHAVQNHTHPSNAYCLNTSGYEANNYLLFGKGGNYGSFNTGTMASGNMAAETRPRNVALLYCVKY
ncbi:tail fiber protein [Megalodesulfovibrio paquesii]